MKKKVGQVEDFFVQMIGIILAFAVMLSGIHYADVTTKYNNANQIAREYILKMESHGGLDETDAPALIDKMDKKGYKNLDISESTFKSERIQYGSEVRLVMKFDLYVKSIEINGLNIKTVMKTKHIVITKASTSKQ